MRRENILLLLLVLLCSFGLGDLFKYHYLTGPELIKNKEIIAIWKDIITILGFIIGAFLAYLRFFAGRTFSPKAEIEITVSLIETPNKTILHTVTVAILNIGNLTIWNPKAKIEISQHTANPHEKREIVERFLEKSYFGDKGKRDFVVDAGETSYFMVWREFEKATWAVTYMAEIVAKGGRKWQKTVTIANKIDTT